MKRSDGEKPENAKSILKRHKIRPSKGLGQSFLIDQSIFERIVAASNLEPHDTVLEVGPGVGLLTRLLAERVANVVAVELDRKMLPILDDTLRGYSNVHIVHGDILDIDPVAELANVLGLEDVASLRYHVVANLPYYITSAALRHLLDARVRPQQLTLMVQSEVAQRVIAPPGHLSLLAISVQVFGEPEMVCRVPASAFYPRPNVESALLRVRLYKEPRVAQGELGRFFRVVRAGFAQKRKQIHNSLTHNLHIPHGSVLAALRDAGIATTRRPQSLAIEEWATLARVLPLPGI